MTPTIEFDADKRRRNFENHGVDLADFARMDVRTARATEDRRRDYGERRLIVYGLIDGRLHAAVATPRGGGLRVISLRKANDREKRAYERS